MTVNTVIFFKFLDENGVLKMRVELMLLSVRKNFLHRRPKPQQLRNLSGMEPELETPRDLFQSSLRKPRCLRSGVKERKKDPASESPVCTRVTS